MTTSTPLAVYCVDAFTPTPYAGNTAAVCVLPNEDTLDKSQFLRIAQEMKHSESCFVVPVDEKEGLYHLRWFTPQVEITIMYSEVYLYGKGITAMVSNGFSSLGHGTLASAHVLFEEEKVSHPTLRFNTLSGELQVTRDGSTYMMNFPASDVRPITWEQTDVDALASLLTIDAEDILELYHNRSMNKLIVRVNHYDVVIKVKPSIKNLLGHPFPVPVRGISVSTTSLDGSPISGKFDFCSRYFAPWVGIDEDPVNGKSKLRAFMASARTGILGLELQKDEEQEDITKRREEGQLVGNHERVIIKGEAATSLWGKVAYPAKS